MAGSRGARVASVMAAVRRLAGSKDRGDRPRASPPTAREVGRTKENAPANDGPPRPWSVWVRAVVLAALVGGAAGALAAMWVTVVQGLGL